MELQNNVFVLDSLFGFEPEKASNWQGGRCEDGTLVFEQETVSFDYAVGYTGTGNAVAKEVTFTLAAKNFVADGEPTANEAGAAIAGVRVYPNPSNGLFTVETGGAAQAEVFAAGGREAARYEWPAGTHGLDLRTAPSGLYYLRLTSNGAVKTVKLLVR